ncbi:baseplate J/gp47 family protein [Paenibacillus wenxiniae]|uniref:Baseplate J/gp47 family protein n=1 Tax=Paenibacillus wenxiniae TaxID=1636843 RepID=A0ABW4RKK8_9BACL
MLDETGFKRKRFEDLFAEIEDKAKETLGDNINTSERSPLGILLRLMAWFLAVLWSVAEKVYYSGYVNTAEGASLDRLAPYVGVSRILEQYATATVSITGTPGYTVPAGFLVATSEDFQFETTEDMKLGSNGTGTVAVEAMESGLDSNVAAGTIKVIVNPTPDVTAVNNPAPAAGGRSKQTDAEFRALFDASVASGGAGTVDAIKATLGAVPGVRAVEVIENRTMNVDSSGRPPKSFEAYTLGGNPADIGAALQSVKAGGIEPYGSIKVQTPDIGGTMRDMYYSPAVVVPIHIQLGVYKTSSYPADGDAQIRLALTQFIGGRAADGTVYAGLTMGDDVVRMRLASKIYAIPGVEDVTVKLSKTTTGYQEQNIVIDINQVAQTDANWIEVTDYDFSR